MLNGFLRSSLESARYHGGRIVGDAETFFVVVVQFFEHRLDAWPAGFSDENEVAVFRAHLGFFHDVDDFVKRDFDVRLGDERIAQGYLGLRARVYGQNSVVLLYARGESQKFVCFAVHARFVHKTEAAAERAVFHGFVNKLHFLFDLRRGERRRIVTGNAYARRAVPDERDYVDE